MVGIVGILLAFELISLFIFCTLFLERKINDILRERYGLTNSVDIDCMIVNMFFIALLLGWLMAPYFVFFFIKNVIISGR